MSRQSPRSNSWVVEVGAERLGIESVEALREILSRARAATRQELWLVHPGGSRICMLRNEVRAMLMFQADDDDTGLVARARGGNATPSDGTVEFTLANGQRDAYPAAWTVSAPEAEAALEHFFTMSEMTPSLEWRDGADVR